MHHGEGRGDHYVRTRGAGVEDMLLVTHIDRQELSYCGFEDPHGISRLLAT